MNKFFLKLSLIIATVAIVLSSCSKDDDNDPASNNSLNGKTTAEFNSSVTYGTMTDQDGNVYKTVTIGTQTWMAENLRTTKYNDGSAIPLVTEDKEWYDSTIGAYCNYNNTSKTDVIATYGRLYNWYTVNTGKLAPTGWHVPTDAEWTILITYLGGESVAGGKLKETGTTHWDRPNTSATNEIGFTALPGGFRNSSSAAFDGINNHGCWWSVTEDDYGFALSRGVDYYFSNVSSSLYTKEFGLSVRCVRD